MSLAVLKRKTKATYKTKKGTFSLNGTQRNLSYVGKNYAGMTRNPYCFTNSKTIKKSVGNQNTVIRNRTEFSKKDMDIESLVNSEGETIDIYVSPTLADNIDTITESSQVNVVSSNGNKYVFNGDTTYNEDLQYGLYNGSYTFTGISQSHPLAILNNGKTDLISYTGESPVLTKDVDGITYNFYYGDIQVEVSGDFGEVSVWCYYHGAMGGENLLTYATPHYRFYTDSDGSNELSPHLTLNLNNTYVFYRVQDDYVDQHPFYMSTSGAYPLEEPSTDITLSGDGDLVGGAGGGITDNESFTLTFNNMNLNYELYYFCTTHGNVMMHKFTLVVEGICTNLPRAGTFQTICNNWVQRVEPDGNVSQAEYIKNKRILATTTQDTSKKQSGTARCDSNGKPCISTYVDTTKEVMKSSDYNSVAISKRASIYRAWQKPFPYVVSAGNSKCIKRNSQANELINTYYKGACDGMTICNDNLCD